MGSTVWVVETRCAKCVAVPPPAGTFCCGQAKHKLIVCAGEQEAIRKQAELLYEGHKSERWLM